MTDTLLARESTTGTDRRPGAGGRDQTETEDFVVDLTFTFAPVGPARAALLRAVVAPGHEQDRVMAEDCLAITTVVAAPTQLGAVMAVHDVVRSQLGPLEAQVTGTQVLSAGLCDLLALVDFDAHDEEPVDVDIPLLIERHLWSRPAWAYEEYVAAERFRAAGRG